MRRSLVALAIVAALASGAARGATCNDPSGFIKSFGNINIGDALALGPDCKHAQDAAFSTLGVVPTQSVVTISAAGINWPNHNLLLGTPVIFSTTGTLPSPLLPIPAFSNPVAVYAIPIDANNFSVASTPQNALAKIALVLSGSGTGVHTAIANAVACAGCIGEAIWQIVPIASCVHFTSGTTGQTWATLNLTAGVWDISHQTGVISGTGGDTFTHMHASIGANITSIETSPGFGDVTAAHISSTNNNGWIFGGNQKPVFTTSTTPFNANATADYSPGVNTGCFYGTAYAIRRY